ncbi:PAS domain-containing protein [Pseudomonas sp. S2_F03]
MQAINAKVLGALENVMVISTTDLQGNITYVNDLFCKLTGYNKEELLGQPHSIVRHASVPKSTYKQMWDTIKKGEIWTGVIPNVGKGGGSTWSTPRCNRCSTSRATSLSTSAFVV